MALSVTVHGITVKTGVQTSGRQATADITTKNGLETVLYTAPSSAGFDYAIVAVSITNREASSTDGVYLAVADSDISKPADWIEWNTTLVPNGVLERTQIVVQSGQRTGAFDINTAGQIAFTMSEGDTGELSTNGGLSLTDGESYRAYVSFYSTEVVGLSSAINLEARDINGPVWVPLIALSLEQRDRTDAYHSYSFDFTVDNGVGTYTTGIDYLRLDMADVNATIDRIGLIQIS